MSYIYTPLTGPRSPAWGPELGRGNVPTANRRLLTRAPGPERSDPDEGTEPRQATRRVLPFQRERSQDVSIERFRAWKRLSGDGRLSFAPPPRPDYPLNPRKETGMSDWSRRNFLRGAAGGLGMVVIPTFLTRSGNLFASPTPGIATPAKNLNATYFATSFGVDEQVIRKAMTAALSKGGVRRPLLPAPDQQLRRSGGRIGQPGILLGRPGGRRTGRRRGPDRLRIHRRADSRVDHRSRQDGRDDRTG